jgi:hypothetical protein
MSVDVHIHGDVDVKLFEAQPHKHGEFISITNYNSKMKERVSVYISEDCIDSFIQQMSVICALRFKNKGSE